MPLTKIALENFTAFDNIIIPLNKGLNVLIGENGTGKTHVMNVLYAACQSSEYDTSFPDEICGMFGTTSIGHLVNRDSENNKLAHIYVESDKTNLDLSFSIDNKVSSVEERWRANTNISSLYFPQFFYTKTNKDTQQHLKLSKKFDFGNLILEDRYFKVKTTKEELYSNLTSEGFKKMAIVIRLLASGILEKGSILFWDNPEVGINPKYISILADLLLELESKGVQIFISTHNYFLPNYIDARRKRENNIQYISLYRGEEEKIKCETETKFDLLTHNSIIDAYVQLYEEEISTIFK